MQPASFFSVLQEEEISIHSKILQGYGTTVLVLEYNHETRLVSKMFLEVLGYRVLTAGTPSEAICLADEHEGEIELLITDVIMAEMNGPNLAEWMLIFYPGMKMLFMSSDSANVNAGLGVFEETVNFIRKPFSINDLAGKVRKALERVNDY